MKIGGVFILLIYVFEDLLCVSILFGIKFIVVSKIGVIFVFIGLIV